MKKFGGYSVSYKTSFCCTALWAALLFAGCGEEDAAGPRDFSVRNGDVQLAARLWLPGPDKYPVVIVVEGAGASPKENFAPRSDIFTENGIAVVAYDKRGLFGSTGNSVAVTVENSVSSIGLLASDLAAVVNALRSNANVDPTRIGLFCSDQGAWVGVLAQTLTNDISCAVHIVGPATSIGIKTYYDQLSGNDPSGNNLSGLTLTEIDSMVSAFQGPIGFDPVPHLKKISAPQLWILGELDFINPTRQSVAVLEDLIASQGSQIDIVVVSNANNRLYDIVMNKQFRGGDLMVGWFSDVLY